MMMARAPGVGFYQPRVTLTLSTSSANNHHHQMQLTNAIKTETKANKQTNKAKGDTHSVNLLTILIPLMQQTNATKKN